MPLIKDGRLVDDPWVAVNDSTDLPADGQLLVSFDVWRANRGILAERDAPIGVRLDPGQSPAVIADDLDRFDLIALPFAKFTDGRAYSHARLLRERHGFTGELRAVGQVLRDQFLFMHRCGFDAFEVADGEVAAGWQQALSEIGVVYQPTGDRRPPALALRQSRRPAEEGSDATVCAAYWAY